MDTSRIESTAIKHINRIQDHSLKKEFSQMIEKVRALTKILYNDKSLIYSSINLEIEKASVVQLLGTMMVSLNEQGQRNVLRMINIFVKTNHKLRNVMSANSSFMQYLLKKLHNREIWNSVDKIKYEVHIASYLLMNRETHLQYETGFICRIVRQILSQSKSNENDPKRILYMMFLSSASRVVNDDSFDEYDDDYNLILCKEIRNWFIDTIRDYLTDFKVFYDSSMSEKSVYYKYCLKVEYSFDQILNCIYYFSQLSKTLRQDIYQSGFYETLSSIFLIKNVPEVFILYSINIFTIPIIDESLKERFRSEHRTIIDKLRMYQTSNSLEVKTAIEKILVNYERTSRSSSIQKSLNHRSIQTEDSIITWPPLSTNLEPLTSNWRSLDVENWLVENNLESCRQYLTSLTGKGLNQMKLLMNETDGRSKLIELLTSKLDMDFVMVLELVGTLELHNAFSD